ncbi:hypothetical protein NQ318_003716 [Aromia moschata]|uniref:Uncharacterized protein n=1 Tax=Aromia moschata TaxID=1265417 RepID=A0AAV8YIY5_9CUCU|nr:hypothetical protein NQ318_003716 [Aromia moschata]
MQMSSPTLWDRPHSPHIVSEKYRYHPPSKALWNCPQYPSQCLSSSSWDRPHSPPRIISNFVIGPFELPPNLTGPRYLNCPQHHLNELLEDDPLATKRKRALCMTEHHHNLPCQYANICMSIFVID